MKERKTDTKILDHIFVCLCKRMKNATYNFKHNTRNLLNLFFLWVLPPTVLFCLGQTLHAHHFAQYSWLVSRWIVKRFSLWYNRQDIPVRFLFFFVSFISFSIYLRYKVRINLWLLREFLIYSCNFGFCSRGFLLLLLLLVWLLAALWLWNHYCCACS